MPSVKENGSPRIDTLSGWILRLNGSGKSGELAQEISQRLLASASGKDKQVIPMIKTILSVDPIPNGNFLLEVKIPNNLATAQLSLMEIIAENDLKRRRIVEILKTNDGLKKALCSIIERDCSKLLISKPEEYKTYEEIRIKALSITPQSKCHKRHDKGCPITSEIVFGKDGKDPKMFHSLIGFLQQDMPKGINQKNLHFFKFAVFSKAIGVELLRFLVENYRDDRSVSQVLSETLISDPLKKTSQFCKEVRKFSWSEIVSRIIEQASADIDSIRE